MSKVTEIISELAEPVCRSLGCELWDVEYVREAGTLYLRVFIDKDGGVSINDCVQVTEALDPILDERDPIPESYTFEVSSAGAERQLKRPSDFERFTGSLVTVKLYAAKNGEKEHIGYLTGYEDGAVSIKTKTGADERFEKKEVADVRLRLDI